MYKPIGDDIKCGVCSGIPPSCILWFVLVWKVLCIFLDRIKRHDMIVRTSWRSYYSGFQYVPCPVCRVMNKPRIIRRCGGYAYTRGVCC